MYRLLIADDEQIERMVLHKTIAGQMSDLCEIFVAENGREALAVYEEKQIQIAILDIEMPGINGIEAAEQIRAKDPDCCIIFLTAYDDFNYAKKAITIRALDYLLKPYQEEELFSVIEAAIHQIESRNKQKPEIQTAVLPVMESLGNMRVYTVVELIETYIRENYMQDISMQQVARAMNYSEVYFCKLFKQYFDKNFTAYLTEVRMEQAKQLLQEATANVKQVGISVGYADSNYFAKVFRRYTGSSPTEYRGGLYHKGEPK